MSRVSAEKIKCIPGLVKSRNEKELYEVFIEIRVMDAG